MNNATPFQTSIHNLTQKLTTAKDIPLDLAQKAQELINRAGSAIQYSGNYTQLDIVEKYIDCIVRIPWNTITQDTMDITHAKTLLDNRHYGLEKIKTRILEYLAVIAMQKKQNPTATVRAPALFFVGLAGTGKTTFAFSIAEALGRKIVRIPFGGLANALDLRGQSRLSSYATPGIIIRSIIDCGVANPVILLDELDRTNPIDRPAIMGALLEILDPNQNNHFTDNFVDYPFDLSRCLFIATSNNTRDVATAVLDRLELIQMPSYNDAEKIAIGKTFVLPHYMRETGLNESTFTFEENTWQKLVRPLGYEPGIRSLERAIDAITRKATYEIVSGQKNHVIINESTLHLYVEGFLVG